MVGLLGIVVDKFLSGESDVTFDEVVIDCLFNEGATTGLSNVVGTAYVCLLIENLLSFCSPVIVCV